MKRTVTFTVRRVVAPSYLDDAWFDLYNAPSSGGKSVGVLHLEGFAYPRELKKARNASVTVDFEISGEAVKP